MGSARKMGAILINKYNMQKLWQTNLHHGGKNSQQRHEKNDMLRCCTFDNR